jgi:lipopolysaccharide export system protein LptA
MVQAPMTDPKPASRPLLTIGGLRWLLVAGALALVCVLAGYIGYARVMARLHGLKVPKIRGLSYDPETDGFVYAPSNGTRKLYEVRASRQIKHKDGNLTLKNVGIELYGKSGERTDRIHGDQFEYDPKTGVITAVGTVFIDLAPPPPAAGKPVKDDESRIIHLKTDGLVFRQKEEFASTENKLEFMAGGMTGTAVGATYDSNAGVVVLQSQVHVSGLRGDTAGNGRPTVLTASHAELNRNGNVAVLEMAKLISAGDSGAETAMAAHAVVHLTADGTPRHVDANGNVTLTGEGRGTVTADRLDLDLNAEGQPSAAHLIGVVRFTNDAEDRQEYGKADDARIGFDAQGRPVHAVMTGAVEADLSGKSAQGDNARWLGADKVELGLGGGGRQPVVVRSAVATAAGGARMRMVDAVVRKDARGKAMAGILRTNVTADGLTGRFAANGKQTELTGVDGAGRTIVERWLVNTPGGVAEWHDTGTGDALKMDFRAVSVPGAKAVKKTELVRAEQRGSVRLVREALAKSDARADGKKPLGAMEVEHAEGDDVVYEAESQKTTMTGQVKVSDPESALFADRVTFDQSTGDAAAEGTVRVSYLQQGSTGEPLHVLAGRALGHKATGITQFFGGAGAGPGGNARMWQGGSQVEAPVLDLDRTKKTLLAHGAGTGTGGAGSAGPVVKTVLVDANPPKAKPAATGKASATQKQQGNAPVRVLSREMLYTDATRQVFFKGQVQAEDRDGVLRAQEATAYLSPKDAAAKEPAAPVSLGGRVERIVATGAVEVEQPGRKATGERLVYTESDRTYVLTGTAAAPPRMVDDTQGKVTGAQLRFRGGDDSVEVLSGAGQERVHTETRMKQKE